MSKRLHAVVTSLGSAFTFNKALGDTRDSIGLAPQRPPLKQS